MWRSSSFRPWTTPGRSSPRRVERLVDRKRDAVLGLATGSSPLPLYRALRRRVDQGLDLSRVRGFALDEYVGLSPEDDRSYAATIDREVTRPLGLDPALVAVPDGAAARQDAVTWSR